MAAAAVSRTWPLRPVTRVLADPQLGDERSVGSFLEGDWKIDCSVRSGSRFMTLNFRVPRRITLLLGARPAALVTSPGFGSGLTLSIGKIFYRMQREMSHRRRAKEAAAGLRRASDNRTRND